MTIGGYLSGVEANTRDGSCNKLQSATQKTAEKQDPPTPTPTPEVCDGVDNDLSGTPDDDLTAPLARPPWSHSRSVRHRRCRQPLLDSRCDHGRRSKTHGRPASHDLDQRGLADDHTGQLVVP